MTAVESQLSAVADFGAALSDVTGLESVVDTALASIDNILGFHHVLLMIHQPENDRLTTIASHGYDVVGIGSEVRLGEGVIGTVAQSRRSMRIGNLQRMLAYLRTVQQVAADADQPSATIRLPGLAGARSQVAAPMVAGGVLIGVIAAESEQAMAFDEADELVLSIAGQLIAAALERAEIIDRVDETEPDGVPESDDEPETDDECVPQPVADAHRTVPAARPAAHLRHYTTDGSTFVDDEYVIKGVAGRLLWKLASEHVATGRRAYTNREARLDPSLDMPNFRDNFESRLVLLKRRLEERDAPLRINRTGRGRFEVESLAPITLERMEQI